MKTPDQTKKMLLDAFSDMSMLDQMKYLIIRGYWSKIIDLIKHDISYSVDHGGFGHVTTKKNAKEALLDLARQQANYKEIRESPFISSEN